MNSLKKTLKALPFLAFFLLNGCPFVVDDDEFFFVPNDFHTIQEALDFAIPGETIFIQSGVYSPFTNGEFFPLFIPDGVSLEGEGPETTILDAENTSYIMDIFNVNGSVISNFTLQNGLGGSGGGVFIQNSSAVLLQNLYVINNRASDAGSGIYVTTSDGISMTNLVVANNVSFPAGGDAAQVEVADAFVTFNNNTVAFGDSDGLRLEDEATGIFENNIFYQNGSAGFGVGFADTAFTSSANIFYNLLFGNVENDFFLDGVLLTAAEANALAPSQINNNFNADPLFTNPAVGDFTLLPGSPALNAGDPNPVFNNPDGSRNTIGAFGGPNAQLP